MIKDTIYPVSVVVISTNEGEELRACLESLYRNEIAFECIVVDNASTDDTPLILSAYRQREGFRSIRLEEKKGFIENNNLAMQEARGRYVLLLNPDTIVQANTLASMVEFMEKYPQCAVATCRLVFPDGSIQHNCRTFPTPVTYFIRILRLDTLFPNMKVVRDYLMKDFLHSEVAEVDWFITAFFFMRRSHIDEIGGLDRTLLQPFYCEDLEWCFRAALSGHKRYFVPDTEVIHAYRRSSRAGINRLTWIHLANIALFYRKHGMSMLLGRHRMRSNLSRQETPG